MVHCRETHGERGVCCRAKSRAVQSFLCIHSVRNYEFGLGSSFSKLNNLIYTTIKYYHYTVDGIIFVGYQFLWRVQSTKSSTHEKAIFCMNHELMKENAMASNFEPHE